MHELTEEFQGQLLRYRLVRHQAIANSRFRTAGLSPNISGVAQVLGAVVEGADNIQSEIITALQGLEESRKAESCETQEAIAIEAALVPCHEGKPSALISELTEIANAILVARGERPLFTPRLFAGTLRRLELPTIRQARGFELPLDTWTCRRIHKLGQVLGVLSLLKPVAECTYCSSTPETEAGSPA